MIFAFRTSPRTMSGVFLFLLYGICMPGVAGQPQLAPGEAFPGGEATHNKTLDANSFSHSSANLEFKDELDFKVGNGFFRRVWVSSPASTKAADGLGPLFNSRGCQRCHIKDGRGHPPPDNQTLSESLLIKLSIPPQTPEQQALVDTGRAGNIPEPVYGGQLQGLSVQGIVAEGRVQIDYEPVAVPSPDGRNIVLQKPLYRIEDLGYGPLHPDVMLGPRVAPQMIGLGLLEAIDEADILAQADPDDRDNDGISGKANQVWSLEENAVVLGRFGHKAGAPSLNQQNQTAFFNDIGLSVPLFADANGDCTPSQPDCLAAPNGASPQYENLEVHSEITDLVLFYTRNLAVPPRREPASAEVLAGKQHFNAIGCTACHTPGYTTGELAGQPHLSNQRIWPYTDMLLHDLGDDLGDGFSNALASGNEWRTAPLWGIGLTEVVNGHTRFLHDGRAGNLREAILWHGGEAAKSRSAFLGLSEAEQAELLRFVKSL